MRVDGGVWNHAAATPLTRGDGMGELPATVYSPGWASGEGCALASTVWDATVAECASCS